jgi:hypothetical protein
MDNYPAHTPPKKWGAMDSLSGSIVTHTKDQALSKRLFFKRQKTLKGYYLILAIVTFPNESISLWTIRLLRVVPRSVLLSCRIYAL